MLRRFAFSLFFVLAVFFEFAFHRAVAFPELFFIFATIISMSITMTAFVFPRVGE
jgi:hypothetical protein